MSEPRPVIAISTPIVQASFGVWDTRSAVIPAVYGEAVRCAGGLGLLSLVTVDKKVTINAFSLE